MSLLSNIFKELDFKVDEVPLHENNDKEVNIVTLPVVHHDDQEPVNVIWPNATRGPWIAGGACLRWYQGLPVGENDIDIFCNSHQQAIKVVENIKSWGRYSTKHESDNAITLSYYSKGDYTKNWTLQVIKRRYFNSLQEVVDSFDISVCQIGTTGEQWLLGNNTAKDIREKNLRMNAPLQPDAAKRLIKYWTYGYRPVEGLLDDIRNNPEANKTFQVDGDYENAF